MEVLTRRAVREPIGCDVSDYSDEWVEGHYGITLPSAIVHKFNRVSARQGFPEKLPWL